MVLCALALIPEGGTGLSSPRRSVRVLIGDAHEVWALDRCRESQWERGSHKVRNYCALDPRYGVSTGGGIAQAE